MAIDPYRNFRFLVEIGGDTVGGFSKVTIPGHKVETIPYREGGQNDTQRKLPGQSTFEPCVFERGMTDDASFSEWIKEIFDIDLDADEAQGSNSGFRRNVVIKMRAKDRSVVRTWTLLRAWPAAHEPGELDANANEVMIEKLTLEYEGYKLVHTPSATQ
jgi:phage tail-like protein